MNDTHYELQLLVAGQPVRDFTYSGTRCLLVEIGQAFALRFINRSRNRVEALIAVDGLSVMDGKLAGDSPAGGYLVTPGQTLDVPGYRLDAMKVASFMVTSTAGAYATQIGATTDVGIIGVRVYAEEPPAYRPCSAASEPRYRGGTGGSGGGDYSRGGPMRGGPMLGEPTRGGAGTGFGAAVEHAVREVSFKRGSLLAELLAEYNTVEGFAAEGVVVPPVRRVKVAFPKAGGCTPPVGWTG